MKIGKLHVAHCVALAPMEEHTNHPFRLLMKQFGASLVCTERVDAVDVARRDRRAMRLLYTTSQEAPRAGQISGADPVVMAEAARVVEEQGFDLVDLNFECPIRRLLARGEGGALLGDPPRVGRIVAAAVKSVSIPVTLKIRSGPNSDRETAVDVARVAEQAGAAAVEVHARNVAQAYVGGPDWSVVERVKRAVATPVFGSGGIRCATDAVTFRKSSGADGVSIGRGCLGNPWIFRQARALVQGGAAVAAPTLAERGRVLMQLAEAEFRLYGANLALRRLPRASCYFAKVLPDFRAFRDAVQHVRSLHDLRRLVKEHFG
jgi:nifR3 family TIM-barrel protein